MITNTQKISKSYYKALYEITKLLVNLGTCDDHEHKAIKFAEMYFGIKHCLKKEG